MLNIFFKLKKLATEKRTLKILGLTIIGTTLLTNVTVEAREVTLRECVLNYTQNLGISPDKAFDECEKKSLVECVRSLVSTRVVGKAILQDNQRTEKVYLVDLGEHTPNWLQGQNWRAKDCEPNTDGPSVKEINYFSSGLQGPYFRRTNYYSYGSSTLEWFRQGWCATPEITLDINYSVQESETLCELGIKPNQASLP